MPKPRRKKKFRPTQGVAPRRDPKAGEHEAVYKRVLDFVRNDGNEHMTPPALLENALWNAYIRFCVELGVTAARIEERVGPCHEHHSKELAEDGPVLVFPDRRH